MSPFLKGKISRIIKQVVDIILGRLPCQCASHFYLNKARYIIVYAVPKCQQLEAISCCFPPQLKKMLMPLRGLRDLQFTVNYFNQIIGSFFLGVQLVSTWGMEVFIWSVGG